jgi:LysR family transcriptional activator of nhaA
MSTAFNYKHLYYFWVVAKEGGISRAADKLDMAVQTVSAQVRELERSLGYALLKPAGRGLVLTDAGLAAMQQADQIFQLGEDLPARVRDAVSTPAVRLAVGICDGSAQTGGAPAHATRHGRAQFATAVPRGKAGRLAG